MKKILLCLVLIILLVGCNGDKHYVYWTDISESQLLRLDAANIQYMTRGEEIWIREKDLNKVVACCS